MDSVRIDLLHILGEVPEGRWAVFRLPQGDGTQMVSVVVPHTLWSLVSRRHPFDSDVSLMERIGTRAIERVLAAGCLTEPVLAEAADAAVEMGVERNWFSVVRRCPRCGQDVPPGEVLEGLSNALPPNSRGEVEILVLCPDCRVQTPHRLTPYGIPHT